MEVAPPAAPATPAAPPPPPMYSATPSGTPADGGSYWGFLKEVKWVELTLLALGVMGILHTIHYYRYKLKEDKVANKDLSRRVDGIEQKQIALETKLQQEPSSTGTFF